MLLEPTSRNPDLLDSLFDKDDLSDTIIAVHDAAGGETLQKLFLSRPVLISRLVSLLLHFSHCCFELSLDASFLVFSSGFSEATEKKLINIKKLARAPTSGGLSNDLILQELSPFFEPGS